jgi:hypothetical protein
VGSSNVSFTTKSFVFAFIAFLAGLISLSVDSTLCFCKMQCKARQWTECALLQVWVVFNMRILIILKHAMCDEVLRFSWQVYEDYCLLRCDTE